jgi:hypothetical protein
LGKKWEKKPKKREERNKRKLYKGLGEKRKSMVKGSVTVSGSILQLADDDSTSTLNLRRKKEKEEMRRALKRSYPQSGPSVLLEGSVLGGQFGNSFIPSSGVQGLGLAEGHRGLFRAQPVTGRIIKRKHKGLTLYRAEIDINPNIRPQPL